MDSVTYRVVFEPGFPWFLPLFALMLIVAGVWGVRKNGVTQAGSAFLLLLVVPAILGFAGLTYSRYLDLREAARSSDTPMVEGVVEHFTPESFVHLSGESEEFTVRGIPFSYSSAIITEAFNHTASHGGPIREGLRVRIRYVPWGLGDNRIVKLEIADTNGKTGSLLVLSQ